MPESLLGGFLYSGFTKPGKYPYINVEQTESGHFIMMDDTPGNETIRIEHGKIFKNRDGDDVKTFWQVDHTGSVENRIAGNNFTVIVNNNNVVVEGVCDVTIKSDAKLKVYGDVFADVGGGMIAKVEGSVNLTSRGEVDLQADSGVNITAGNPLNSSNPLTAPDVNIISGGAVNITGDLRVSGSITGGASINATTNLTAAMKCYTLGGIETMGGINVGFSTPGPILPTGVLIAATTVTAPIVNGGIVNGGLVNGFLVRDAMGFMAMLRMAYNIHFHGAYGGPTTPPIKPDVGVGGGSTGAPPIPGLTGGGTMI